MLFGRSSPIPSLLELPFPWRLFIPCKALEIRHCNVHVCKILQILFASYEALGSILLHRSRTPASVTAFLGVAERTLQGSRMGRPVVLMFLSLMGFDYTVEERGC